MGIDANVLLPRHAALRGADSRAGGDADLRLDQVDPGHAFGDGVLDLNARIDLDEVELAGVGVLQELDGAGGAVADGAADLERRLAQIGALRIAEKRRRRAFNHLLIAALHGAIALVQMHEIAVGVAQDLHFDMPRAADQLLEIHLVLAEGRLGFAPRGRHGLDELPVVFDDAHAAPAAAPTRLEHHREADGLRHGQRLRVIIGQGRRCRHHRHSRAPPPRLRASTLLPSRRMVSGSRADENDAGRGAGLGELGTLRQEAIARVNRVGTSLDGDADDVGDIEIGVDRSLALAHQVTLVGLGPMQREAVLDASEWRWCECRVPWPHA